MQDHVIRSWGIAQHSDSKAVWNQMYGFLAACAHARPDARETYVFLGKIAALRAKGTRKINH